MNSILSKRLRQFVVGIVFLSLLVWICLYIKNHLQEFRAVRIISVIDLVILFLLTPIYFYSQAIILKLILKSFGIKLRFNEWFGLTMMTMMGNFILPFSGLGFRAVYLKKVYGFDLRHFISTLSAIWIVNFLVFTAAGLFALVFIWRQGHSFDLKTALFLGVLFLLALILWFIPFGKFKSKNKFLKRFNLISESWQKVKTDRELVIRLVYWSTIELFLFVMTFYFAFRTFGFNISFVGAFLPASLTNFSYFVRLLPASFGLYEGAILYASKVLGFTAVQALTVTALTRLIFSLWIFSLGLTFSYLLSKKPSKKSAK